MTESARPDPAGIAAWLATRLPDDWFIGPVEVVVDREELTMVGPLPDDASVRDFRERTRDERVKLARELERSYGRTVAWGVACGGSRQMFTRLAVPVMTRLKQDERLVLDTLVAAGVARSRSDALAWCVRLVGQHEGDWLTSLRAALVAVQQARATGPSA